MDAKARSCTVPIMEAAMDVVEAAMDVGGRYLPVMADVPPQEGGIVLLVSNLRLPSTSRSRRG